MQKYIELKERYDNDRMLIPLSSIVSIKETKYGSLVFVKDLQLICEYRIHETENTPDNFRWYQGVEPLQVSNPYTELSFLLQGAPGNAD